jgi:hypothetical protein
MKDEYNNNNQNENGMGLSQPSQRPASPSRQHHHREQTPMVVVAPPPPPPRRLPREMISSITESRGDFSDEEEESNSFSRISKKEEEEEDNNKNKNTSVNPLLHEAPRVPQRIASDPQLPEEYSGREQKEEDHTVALPQPLLLLQKEAPRYPQRIPSELESMAEDDQEDGNDTNSKSKSRSNGTGDRKEEGRPLEEMPHNNEVQFVVLKGVNEEEPPSSSSRIWPVWPRRNKNQQPRANVSTKKKKRQRSSAVTSAMGRRTPSSSLEMISELTEFSMHQEEDDEDDLDVDDQDDKDVEANTVLKNDVAQHDDGASVQSETSSMKRVRFKEEPDKGIVNDDKAAIPLAVPFSPPLRRWSANGKDGDGRLTYSPRKKSPSADPTTAKRRVSPSFRTSSLQSLNTLSSTTNATSSKVVEVDLSFDRMVAAEATLSIDAPIRRPMRRASPVSMPEVPNLRNGSSNEFTVPSPRSSISSTPLELDGDLSVAQTV